MKKAFTFLFTFSLFKAKQLYYFLTCPVLEFKLQCNLKKWTSALILWKTPLLCCLAWNLLQMTNVLAFTKPPEVCLEVRISDIFHSTISLTLQLTSKSIWSNYFEQTLYTFNIQNIQYKNFLCCEFFIVTHLNWKYIKHQYKLLLPLLSFWLFWWNIQSYEHIIHVFNHKRSSMNHISSPSQENVEQTLYVSCLS